MKLIDSSAWIEYYRKEGNKDYKICISDAIKNNDAAVNGIIRIFPCIHSLLSGYRIQWR